MSGFRMNSVYPDRIIIQAYIVITFLANLVPYYGVKTLKPMKYVLQHKTNNGVKHNNKQF